MAKPKYKSQLKKHYSSVLRKAQKEANQLLKQQEELDVSKDFDEIMKIRELRNNQLIIAETAQSRLIAIGKQTGVAEYAMPKFNN